MKVIVTVLETLKRSYVVNAKSETDAYDIINDAVMSGDILLTDEDYSEREIVTAALSKKEIKDGWWKDHPVYPPKRERETVEKKNRTLRRWRDNDNMTLDDMYNKAVEKGYTNYRVEPLETIQEFISQKVAEGIHCAELLRSIETNPTADHFAVSLDCANCEAEPIFDKASLYAALTE